MHLTKRQAEVLNFIKRYRKRHGYSPTLEEIGEHFEVNKVTVFEHVSELVRKGYVTRSRSEARSVVPVEEAEQGGLALPLAGMIAAGAPIEAVEAPETIDLKEMLTRGHECFVLRVTGDSMIEEHIRDGDYVIVEKRSTARNGETVVALLEDGSATLKKFYRENGRIRLQPANPNMSPLYVDSVRIQGVVIGVLRKY